MLPRGGVRFAAAPTLAHGELAEEVFAEAPKGVVVQRGGNLCFGAVKQVIEPRRGGQIEDAFGEGCSGFIHALAS